MTESALYLAIILFAFSLLCGVVYLAWPKIKKWMGIDGRPWF